MSNHLEPSAERMLELLADHATRGLDSKTAMELGKLLSLHPDYDASYFEPAAAAIDLAMMPPSSEPLPDGLRDRILSDAVRFVKTKWD